MASPPTANQRTKSRWASSRGSTTKSASSNEEHTGCAMKSTFDSKSSPVCCQRSDASPSFWVRIHPHDFTKSRYFSMVAFTTEQTCHHVHEAEELDTAA